MSQTGSEYAIQRRKSKSKSKKGDSSLVDLTADSDVPFSTVDRAILEELKEKLRARESQFITRNGKKHHPFSAQDVPYPRNYEREVLDQLSLVSLPLFILEQVG